MSSEYQSRPGTPHRDMSIENDPESVTPRATGRRAQADKYTSAPTVTKPQEQSKFIHVLSTQPEKPSESQTGKNGQKSQTEDIIEDTEEDDNAELTEFDWADLERRYVKALTEANKIEDDLNEKFDSYADVAIPHCHLLCTELIVSRPSRFGLKLQLIGIMREPRSGNFALPQLNRCMLTDSSLKTRTLFVQLSEKELENKKQHCKYRRNLRKNSN